MVPFEVVLAVVTMLTGPAVASRQEPRAISLAISHVAQDLDDVFLLALTAKHESDFVADVRGDCRHVGQKNESCASFGTWQLSAHWMRPILALDPFEAAPIALRLLHVSAKTCPREPLAFYASGSCDKGIKVSRSRMREIRALKHRFEALPQAPLSSGFKFMARPCGLVHVPREDAEPRTQSSTRT